MILESLDSHLTLQPYFIVFPATCPSHSATIKVLDDPVHIHLTGDCDSPVLFCLHCISFECPKKRKKTKWDYNLWLTFLDFPQTDINTLSNSTGPEEHYIYISH